MSGGHYEQWSKKNLDRGLCGACGKFPRAWANGVALTLCEFCRTPRKAHLEGVQRGIAACGYKADAEHLVIDPDSVTCGTCQRGSLMRELRRVLSPKPDAWTGTFSKAEAKRLLIERFGPTCFGCGLNATRPNGSIHAGLLDVDHIYARNRANGLKGNDELGNLALLCRTCNGRKGNGKSTQLSLEELRSFNRERGYLHCESTADLPDLFERQEWAIKETQTRIDQHATSFANAVPCRCGSVPAMRQGIPQKKCEDCLRITRINATMKRLRKEASNGHR